MPRTRWPGLPGHGRPVFALLAAIHIGLLIQFHSPYPDSWDAAEYAWALQANYLPHSPYLLFFALGRLSTFLWSDPGGALARRTLPAPLRGGLSGIGGFWDEPTPGPGSGALLRRAVGDHARRALEPASPRDHHRTADRALGALPGAICPAASRRIATRDGAPGPRRPDWRTRRGAVDCKRMANDE